MLDIGFKLGGIKMKDEAYFKQLAHQLMFELSDEEAVDIKKEFETLNKQLELLENVNTEGVEEMVYPFETPTSFLREDCVENVVSVEDALKNVHKSRARHVLVPKVVK